MRTPVFSRRTFLYRAGLAAAACPLAQAFAQPAARPPNIVFILIDDLGWADLGCYGNRFHETPNIDRLAQQGVRFTDAYAAAPVCSPTRASIVSGQYPARVGVTDFIAGHNRPWAKLINVRNRQQYLPLESLTVAEALQQGGYATGMFGKWHLGGREHFPEKQGFEDFLVSNGRHSNFTTWPPKDYPEDAYLSEVLTDRAEQFMETHRGRPFFLYLSHYAVHIPLDARAELVAKYEAKPKPDDGIHNATYAAMVEHVDRSVGRIMDKLKALGLEENTLMVFFSDNGGLRQRFDGKGPLVTSNAPLRDEKGSLYEGGIREPLIVRWPGVVEPGGTCAEPVSSVDFYPTFLEVAGLDAPEGHMLDGASIAPLLRGAPSLERDALYWHYPHYHHTTPAGAIRQGNWKLIEYFEDGRLELYNLAEDLGEKNDRAREMPEKADAMRARLEGWREGVGAAMPEPNPDYDPARAEQWD